MEPLATNKRLLILFCGYSSDEKMSNRQKWANGVFTLFVFICTIIGVTISVRFFHTFVSVDLEASLYTIFQISSTGCAAYVIVFVFVSRHKIAHVLDDLKEIYRQSQGDEAFQFLVEANDKSEWLWRFYIEYVLGGYFVSQAAMSTLSVLGCLLIHRKFDVNYVYHIYKVLMPWNQKVPLGYFADICIQMLCGESYLLPNGLLLLLFISFCLHHRAFHQMFQHTTKELDRNNIQHLVKLIRFHTTVKNWLLQSADVFSPYIVIQLVSSMIILSSAIFEMDLVLRHIDFEVSAIFIATAAGISNLFVYCYFGKLATESFLRMSDSLYEANWIDLPIEQQKRIIFVLINSQKPLYFHGFGVAVLNLETFCEMIKTVFTYYMMFKTLTTN